MQKIHIRHSSERPKTESYFEQQQAHQQDKDDVDTNHPNEDNDCCCFIFYFIIKTVFQLEPNKKSI